MKTFFKGLGYTLLAIICGGSLFLAISDPTIPITIKETQAQSTVASKLPLAKTIDIKILILKDRKADIIIKDATVDFLETGNIRITSVLSIDMDGRFVDGSIDAEGEVVYRDGEFFLGNTKVHEVLIDDFAITEKDQKLLNSGKSLVSVGKAALSKFNKFLKKNDKGGVAENGISKEYLKKTTDKIKADLIIKAKAFAINKLETTPIYKLNPNDSKHNLAKLMLKDIKVNNDSMVITMSVGKLISTLWLYIFAFIAAIAFIVALVKSSSGLGGSGGLGALADISLDL
jgi:hypothetical protein